jgi:hypothetical protein
MDDFPIPEWAKEDLANGRCAIGRCMGQTIIYVPAPLCDRLDAETVRRLAVEVYSQEAIDSFCMSGIYKTENFCQFEVPTSLNRDYARQEENPDYRKPDELVKKIMALAR